MPANNPHSTGRATPPDMRGIDAFAADWLARRDTGLNACEAAEFARWRAADSRHEDAIQRVEATRTLLGRLSETPGADAMFAEIDDIYAAHRRRTRLKVWIPLGAGLAAAATVAFAVWLPGTPTPAAVYTTIADARPAINLPDGSTLALRERSEVRVDFQRHERRLDLASGEAHFAVARDATRPFIVSVGPVTVQAIGTAFTIRRGEQDVDVLVTEGKVLVIRSDANAGPTEAMPPLNLVAGDRARISTAPAARDGGTPAYVVSREPVDDATRLVFANTPLAEVVARFNRHSRIQMEIGDDALEAKTLGGNFDANNAEAFINLLLTSGEISVERVSETRVILRAARPGR